MPTLDAYAVSNQSTGWVMYTGTKIKVGQSWVCSYSGYELTSATFYVKKTGTVTGNMQYTLYAHTGTYGSSSTGTGSPLATSTTYSVASLATSYTSVTLTFPTPYALSVSTYYVMVLEWSGGDISNYLTVGSDNTSPTHGGNTVHYTSGWSYSATQDTCFDVIGTLAPSTNRKTIDGLALASVKTVNHLAIASVKTINGLV